MHPNQIETEVHIYLCHKNGTRKMEEEKILHFKQGTAGKKMNYVRKANAYAQQQTHVILSANTEMNKQKMQQKKMTSGRPQIKPEIWCILRF